MEHNRQYCTVEIYESSENVLNIEFHGEYYENLEHGDKCLYVIFSHSDTFICFGKLDLHTAFWPTVDVQTVNSFRPIPYDPFITLKSTQSRSQNLHNREKDFKVGNLFPKPSKERIFGGNMNANLVRDKMNEVRKKYGDLNFDDEDPVLDEMLKYAFSLSLECLFWFWKYCEATRIRRMMAKEQSLIRALCDCTDWAIDELGHQG